MGRSTMDKTGILLESGTGEVEILKFKVNGKHYAINVVKVREILQLGDTAKVPNANASIMGLTLVRGEVVTVIDLKHVLEGVAFEDTTNKMTLLCEFNQIKVAFCVDEVLGIHRIKWSDMTKPDELLDQSLVIANINLDARIYMLLDFERIVMDISPQTGISVARMQHVAVKDRTKQLLVLADDSPMIRKVLLDTLTLAGYVNMRFFNDGQEAYEYFMDLAERKGHEFNQEAHLLITDIEMPRLDGHTLTRRIKEHKILRELPVIIFSSLITSELRHKGEAVGANAQMSKPEIGQLIEMVDSLLNVR
jgi:two-component system chemotaxis response regulator CheV